MRKFLFIVLFCSVLPAEGQELNASVTINATQVQTSDRGIFKDMKTLTLAERRMNMLFLGYLLQQEKNPFSREKYQNYLDQLTSRLLQLEEN